MCVCVGGGGGRSYKFCQRLNLDSHAQAAREAMALRAEFKILSRHLGALGPEDPGSQVGRETCWHFHIVVSLPATPHVPSFMTIMSLTARETPPQHRLTDELNATAASQAHVLGEARESFWGGGGLQYSTQHWDPSSVLFDHVCKGYAALQRGSNSAFT